MLLVVNGAAQEVKGETIAFQQYSSYYEKNNDGIKGDKIFLAIADRQRFDKIFGAAATMGQNNFLPEGVFDSKIVIATVKRGSLRRYEDVKVTAEKNNLIVSYNAKDDAPSSATFRSPLIIAVDKGKYKSVIFMENGKRVETVKIKS